MRSFILDRSDVSWNVLTDLIGRLDDVEKVVHASLKDVIQTRNWNFSEFSKELRNEECRIYSQYLVVL